MNALRMWRTVRHLTPEQIVYRLVCRGRLVYMNEMPARAHRSIARHAEGLALPKPAAPGLAAVADHVLLLQQAVHGDRPDGVAEGRFTLLGRTIDFGGIDAVEWRRDLNERNNPLWRMNLSYFGYAVPLLARGDGQALRDVASLVQSLERQNPFEAEGVFRDVWHPYSASHRLINLLVGLHLFGRSGQTAPAEQHETLVRHIRFCAAFVRDNLERDLQYNHLLKNYVALVAYACALGGLPAAWRFLDMAVPASVNSQILADGGHAERCPMYHALSILDLMVLVDAGVLDGKATSAVADQLARMKRALAVMTHPDGDIALFNDSWLGEAPPAAALCAEPCADGAQGLPDSGYVQLRSGADAAIFDCGACGPDNNPGHAHADFLAVELSLDGRRLLTDFGVPTYSAGELRDRSRSAGAHNGPRFLGAEPIEFWLSFRVGRRGYAHRLDRLDGGPDAPLWCAGWQDGYAPIGATVARWLALYPGRGALIVDVWAGGADHDAATDFLVCDQWTPIGPRSFKPVGAAQDCGPVCFEAIAGTLDDATAASAWPRFGEEHPAQRLRLHPDGTGARRWSALWIGKTGEAPGAAVAAAARDALFNAIPAP